MKALLKRHFGIFAVLAVGALLTSCQQEEEFFQKDLSPNVGVGVDKDFIDPIDNNGGELPIDENEDDDTVVIIDEPTDPIVIEPVVKDCGDIAHGETIARTKFSVDTVNFGGTCSSEVQKATCNNGTLSAYSGTFTFDSCVILPAKSCGNIAHGETYSVEKYELASVPFGNSCEKETRKAICNNGTLGALSGSFTENSCVVEAAKDCDEIKHGESKTIIVFENETVDFGNTCNSEEKVQTCNNGSLTESNSTFTAEQCVVLEAKDCGDIKNGETESRMMFGSASVDFGSSCSQEKQERTCNNGSFSDWSGSFEYSECIVDSPKVERVEQTFTQNSASKGKVDILWVVDDSGSMGGEQASLATNFSSFITDFLSEDTDFRMGITTTDARSSKIGLSKCSLDLLTSEQASLNQTSFVNNFKSCIKVGTRGSGYEKGFDTGVSFLNRYSQEFIRDDALLIVVNVSDEREQSSMTTDDYLADIRGFKAEAGQVKTYSIVTQTGYNKGQKYIDAAQKTGGMNANILGNFASILKDFGKTIVNLSNSFNLNSLPYDSEIVVKVNGEITTTGWEIDVESGSLKFNEDSTPAEGSEISITYNSLIN